MSKSLRDVSTGIEKVPVLIDSTFKLLSGYQYVPINIPGPNYSHETFLEEYEGCDCNGKCEPSCSCIQRFGPAYDEKGKLLNANPYAEVVPPIYECNRNCECPNNCSNRLVQKGITYRLQVIETEGMGQGLKTLEPISKDSFVCEYSGEILGYESAKARTSALKPTDGNYILVSQEHLNSKEVVTTYVDAALRGNAGRFINHSCEPNLYLTPVRSNNSIPHLCLFAIRDIDEGTILSFDYSGDIQNPRDKKKGDQLDASSQQQLSENLKDQEQPKESERTLKICRCGSDLCRGYLPFDASLY